MITFDKIINVHVCAIRMNARLHTNTLARMHTCMHTRSQIRARGYESIHTWQYSQSVGFCLSVCPSVRLSVCPSVRLSVCPSVRLSVCPSVRLSVCPSVRLSVCPSVRLSVCPSVRLSVCLCC